MLIFTNLILLPIPWVPALTGKGDGWMDGWMDGWVGGWMDGWRTKCINRLWRGRSEWRCSFLVRTCTSMGAPQRCKNIRTVVRARQTSVRARALQCGRCCQPTTMMSERPERSLHGKSKMKEVNDHQQFQVQACTSILLVATIVKYIHCCLSYGSEELKQKSRRSMIRTGVLFSAVNSRSNKT